MVIRARLALGLRLDRPVLREIRRELRRADALARAGRTLARRDVSETGLRTRLERAGVTVGVAGEAAESLRRVGALDDGRFARNRARALCDRGWGDEAIFAKLEEEGAPSWAARDALVDLPPEAERAARVAAGLPPRKALDLLARRGFGLDAAEAVVPGLDGGPEPRLP